MSEVKRLSRVAKECNVGIQTIVDFLHKKGFDIENNPNAKIQPEALALVMKEYQNDQAAKREAVQFKEEHKYESRTTISIEDSPAPQVDEEAEQEEVLLIQDNRGSSKFDLDQVESRPEKKEKKEETQVTAVSIDKPVGPKIVGRVDLEKPKPKAKPVPEPQPEIVQEVKPEPAPEIRNKPEPVTEPVVVPLPAPEPKVKQKPAIKDEPVPVPAITVPEPTVQEKAPEPVVIPEAPVQAAAPVEADQNRKQPKPPRFRKKKLLHAPPWPRIF